MAKCSIEEQYADLVDGHKTWLKQFPNSYLSAWETMFADKPESAIAEAWVRNFLSKNEIECKPNDDPNIGGLDFLCAVADRQFYAEVTNLDASSIGDRTGLPASVNDFGSRVVGSISSKFLGKRRAKQEQIAKCPYKCPVVIAFVCFHESVTFTHFRRDKIESYVLPVTCYSPAQDNDDGSDPTCRGLKWDCNLFFKNGSQPNTREDACPEISAVLFCSAPWNYAGTSTPVTHMVLNPTATNPLNLAGCKGISIGQLPDGWADQDEWEWRLEWSDEASPHISA